jgi:hypothetical protein
VNHKSYESFLKALTAEQYEKDCNDFFAPLDEIAEAVRNGEGINGLNHIKVVNLINENPNLNRRIAGYLL